MTVSGGIVVLDFGGQYTQLIARRIREQQVFSAILPCHATLEEIRQNQPAGIVLSGGPSSVHHPAAPRCDPQVLQLGVPVLGICYGLQWIAHSLGGEVRPASQMAGREYGPAEVLVENGSRLLAGFPKQTKVWMNHGDDVARLPPGFRVYGRTSPPLSRGLGTDASAGIIAVAEDHARGIYAVQFHPEVHHTHRGTDILRNFVLEICGVRPNWSGASFISETVEAIHKQVGEGRALCALSGGVDSAVAAVLVHRAIGERLTNVFVDTGLLRKNEFHDTLELLRGPEPSGMKLNVIGVDASARFLQQLAGVTEPEEKRRRIGAEFIAVFAGVASQLAQKNNAGLQPAPATSGHLPKPPDASVTGHRFLVQGTLYPDVIESVSVKGPSATIKTHHNVGGLPSVMPFALIEPLRDLFKDEVRRIGRELGLPEEMLTKHPFPGPGLAVRVLGPVTRERLDTLREADAIVTEEIRRAGLYQRLWQAFAVLLPVRSVGVMGDDRTYGDTVAVRAVESEDAMTADWSRLPAELLERISARIVNEVRGVSRVVYDITSKPPGTIEWE